MFYIKRETERKNLPLTQELNYIKNKEQIQVKLHI